MRTRLSLLLSLTLAISACASAKFPYGGDGGKDSNSPFDVMMPEAAAGDGMSDGGPLADTLSLDTGPLPDGKVDQKKPTDLAKLSDKTQTVDNKIVGSVTVSTPKGGEVWEAGSQRFITWGSKGVSWVNIDLLKGALKVHTIAVGVQSSGKRAWKVPASLANATTYRVRVTDAQNAKVWGMSPKPFTISNWRYRAPVTINTAKATSSLGNYPVLLELNSSNFAYSHAHAKGWDLRFSLAATPGNWDLKYWVESWQSGGTSKVWVLVPNLQAKTVRTIHMYYGNSGATAGSNLSATFPKRFISTGSMTIGGTQNWSSFELKAGHTLTVSHGSPLVINARRILIKGGINGNGRGYSGGGSSSAGQGPGGGGAGTSAGGGGGGYGGLGGQGGYDGTDSPGVSGISYGTETVPTIMMGSGGGAGGSLAGGAGGASVTLSASYILVSGSIVVDGAPGAGGAQSGGGGAGGGILIKGNEVIIQGQGSARGGKGGSGTSQANDGGGGGGGGRVKLFYEKSLAHSALVDVLGGDGGLYGDASAGKAGGIGSQYKSKASFEVTAVNIGTEKKL